jgi:Ras-related protein Rab-2A
MENCDYVFKYIIVGDSSVGKSCLMLRFTDNRFKPDHDITIGVEFGSKLVKVGKHSVKVQIWDTAGQETFRSIARSYYRGAVSVLLVYDITNKDSFINIYRWLCEIKEQTDHEICITLVGNKLDLNAHRTVKVEEAKEFALNNDLLFVESSALTGANVEAAFTVSCTEILRKIEEGKIDMKKEHTGIRVGESNKKKSCCRSE